MLGQEFNNKKYLNLNFEKTFLDFYEIRFYNTLLMNKVSKKISSKIHVLHR
jgi:hypothetical protein